MKKLLLVLAVVALTTVLFVGCLPAWVTPDELIVPAVMEADVDAVLVLGGEDEADTIAWSIENVGTLDIPAYKITFDVLYPRVIKDNVIFTEVGYELDVGEKHAGSIGLLDYGDTPPYSPETVSVSWELFN